MQRIMTSFKVVGQLSILASDTAAAATTVVLNSEFMMPGSWFEGGLQLLSTLERFGDHMAPVAQCGVMGCTCRLSWATVWDGAAACMIGVG